MNKLYYKLKGKVKNIMKKNTIRAKHERLLIGALDKLNEPIPIHVFTTKPNKIVHSYGTYGGEEVPERIILTGVRAQDGTPNMYYILYYAEEDGFAFQRTTYVDAEFDIGKLTGLQGKVLMNRYKEEMVCDLRGKLSKVNNRIGSDPEVFVVDENDQLIPAFSFLKGKKDADRDMTECNNGNIAYKGVYWDGFQAEFETSDSYCLAYHTDSVHYGLKAVLKAARKFNKKAKLTIKTVMNIPEVLLNTAKEEHVQLGCMPSKNVYNLVGMPIEDGRNMPTRSTGGHIHFGLPNLNKEEKIPLMVKGLDAILGVACVAMFAKYDNPERRKYYGLAGEYRLPEHGMEYRVLSNAWLIHPFIMNLVFDVSRMAASFGASGFLEHWKATEKETIDCINTCDVAKAQEILQRNKKIFIQVLGAAYPRMRDVPKYMNKLFNIFHDGMDTVIESDDIEKNWHLTNNAWVLHGEAADKNCAKSVFTLTNGTVKKLA